MATAYARRSFAGGSVSSTIPTGMGISDASFTLNTGGGTNWPSGSGGNFMVVVDFGLATQEKILCSALSGLVVTVAASGRGYDGSSAVAHLAGCAVQCCHGAQDDDEANQVVAAVLGQSGAAKGDILYMLSAAGPNTLQRLAVGSNGSLLSAASAVPAYTAAGTTGQSLISAGSAVPTWSTRGTNAGATGGAGTTTSASFANLSGTSVAVTLTTNTLVKVTITGSLANSTAGNNNFLGFVISGATTTPAATATAINFNNWFANVIDLHSAVFYTTVTAGSNTFTLQAATNANTLTIANAQIIVECLN